MTASAAVPSSPSPVRPVMTASPAVGIVVPPSAMGMSPAVAIVVGLVARVAPRLSGWGIGAVPRIRRGDALGGPLVAPLMAGPIRPARAGAAHAVAVHYCRGRLSAASWSGQRCVLVQRTAICLVALPPLG